MIALRSDCLMFELANGESIPCSAEMICIEVHGNYADLLDQEMLRHAAASVFHYFKIELARESVTVGEFAGALEKVLRGFGLTLRAGMVDAPSLETIEMDLRLIARETSGSFELLFFPRLRNELHNQLQRSPRVLRFRGLRSCVKQLAGARRWSGRCEKVQEQIVEYLRGCLSAEENRCALVVE